MKDMKLNPYSTQILRYIEKIPELKTIKLSKKTKTLFTNILEQIQTSELAFKKHEMLQIPPPNYKHADLYNSIPYQIRGIVENQPTIQESYQFLVLNRTIRVHFIVQPHTLKIQLKTAIKLVYIWFHFISPYVSNNKCASSLDLYLYWINHNKVLPTNPGEPIEQIHANTAFTWACVENSTIQIFREEEWFKVLIHETFHTFGLDFSTLDVSLCSKKIKDWFSISTEGLLFESYCETWACILNIVFLVFYSTSSQSIKKQLEIIENLLQLETKYALFQSIKVLQHYGLTYRDLVFKTTETKRQREQYSEKTNVFCYNVLKSLILYNLDDFVEWCMINNHNIIEFKKTQAMIENFCKWIEIHYKMPDLLEDYKTIENWYSSSTQKGYIYNTMRMTIFG